MRINCDQVPYLDHRGEFANALLASEYLLKHKVDLIFLDIEMPGLNGLDFLRSLNNKPHVILCTAYPQYALESYELDVIDYLVKPIKFERFFKAINKVKEYTELAAVPSVAVDSYEDSYMYIKSERQYVKVFYDEVVYIKGMKDYVVIQTKDKKYMTSLNVKTIHSKLPPQLFARVSKSYLVQVKHILSIDVNTIYTEKHELPLGPSYKEEFIEKYVKTRPQFELLFQPKEINASWKISNRIIFCPMMLP